MLAGFRTTWTGGATVTLDTAETVGSARLVAITLTVCFEASVAGAVYTPVEEMEPTDGLVDQRTELFEEPVTVAANDWFCEACKTALAGVTATFG